MTRARQSQVNRERHWQVHSLTRGGSRGGGEGPGENGDTLEELPLCSGGLDEHDASSRS